MAKVLCVEIGYATTKICEMDYKSKNPKIYHCIEIPTVQGAVEDGYLVEEKLDGLKNAIQAALLDRKIKTKKVVFSIFSSKIITREVILPAVKPKQIPAVIDANSSEYFPIELNDYVVSHLLLNTLEEGENAGRHKTLVYAAEKRLIIPYEKLATACGWSVENIDYTGNAIYQAVKDSEGQETQMYIRVEPENTIVSIIKNKKLMLQRIVNYGSGVGLSSEEDKRTNREMLISALARVEDYFVAQASGNKLDVIYIMGQVLETDGLAEEISREMQVPCELLKTLKNVRLQPGQELINVAVYASCIGAGMAPVGMNVSSHKNGVEVDYFRTSILLLVAFVVLGVVMVMVSVVPYKDEVRREQELKELETTYLQAKGVYEKYVAIADLYDYIDYGNKLTEHANDGLLHFLEELEEKLPSDVKVAEFQSDDEKAVITMTVADKETAAGVINTLRDFESIMTLNVTDVTEEKEEDKVETGSTLQIYPTETVFTIYCEYYQMEYQAPLTAESITQETAAETVLE